MADGTLKVGTITTSSGSGTITLGQSGETVDMSNATQTGVGGVNTPLFEAGVTTEQNTSDNTWTKINFDKEIFDTDGAYDTSNKRFTVPSNQAGKYFIYSNTTAGSNTNSDTIDVKLAIYKNGSVYKRGYQDARNNNIRYHQVSVAAIMELVVGDYLEMFIQVDPSSGTVEVRNQNDETTFGGYKLIG